MREISHKILLILVAFTIIGELASIILWTTNRPVAGQSSARFSLVVDYRIAVANAAVFTALNLAAFALIFKRNKTGPLFLMAIALINRAISIPIFEGGAHGIFITWTTLLVIFAYVEYRGLKKFETAYLVGGVLLDLALTAVLFNPSTSASYGLIFYFGFLACLVGILLVIKKFR